jgi:hypothetical protein
MKLNAPTSYTAGRKLTIDGVTYQPGAAIPAATVKGLRALGALLSSRRIIPNVDPHRRMKARLRTPAPTGVGAIFRKSL